MPSHTVMVIKNCHEIFRTYDWKSIANEITDCNNLGMDCDVEKWHELRDFAREKLRG